MLGKPLREQRFLLAGSGAAGVGIGRLVRAAMLAEGLSEAGIRQRLIFMDSGGLVSCCRSEMDAHKKEVVLRAEDLAALGLPEPPPTSLEEIVAAVKPGVLIGTTGQPGDFTPAVIRALAAGCDRPIILPLSNPTSKAECTPTEALVHSDGRALVATGSPFEPVIYDSQKVVIGQCNNVFVFPGVGLGVLISEAGRVTDSMFLAAAKALSQFTLAQPACAGCLYPSLRDLRLVSRLIAFKVAQTARDEGLGRTLDDDALQSSIDDFCWFPDYSTPEIQEPKLTRADTRILSPGPTVPSPGI
jgi:malic enzyme